MDGCVQRFAEKQKDVWDLYETLLAVADNEIYDDDFIKGVEYLDKIAPDKSLSLYLMARFYYIAKDYQKAYLYMEKALFYRKIDFNYWKFMFLICGKLGDKIHQYYLSTLLIANEQDGGCLPIPWEDDNLLRTIGQAQLHPSSVPFIMRLSSDGGKIVCDEDNLAGSYIGIGGMGRQYAVSMSIYPGQTFKLCLRDLEYECRLETAAFTEISGRVKMDKYDVHIYRRADRQEITDDGVRERFMKEALRHIQSFVYF